MLSYVNVIEIPINTSNEDCASDELLREAQPQVLRCSDSIRQLTAEAGSLLRYFLSREH